MRHNNKGRKLGRTASHRSATLKALSTALFKHKRIRTTVAKAKETRTFAESLITKAKKDSVHSRRHIAKFINDKAVIQELFSEIIPKIGDRPGGYTRVVKLGRRFGDAAELAILELVDFNDVANQLASEKKERKEERKAAKQEAAQQKAEETATTEEA
ncbi:MAG: 50S ribosomal protein L17 [Bacteroidota bacterium]|nr:50S ribosomal protein L17 [Bacteroidota bacterium]MDP4190647.1 50S ribosomal protein L17 [Bacteroidota bacterium]MDP4194045.1 50S ribosomal protein L17 [Bacteroidota bacterium]